MSQRIGFVCWLHITDLYPEVRVAKVKVNMVW